MHVLLEARITRKLNISFALLASGQAGPVPSRTGARSLHALLPPLHGRGIS